MRLLIVALVVIFIALQIKLWYEQGSVGELFQLRKEIKAQTEQNKQLTARNMALEAEVADLKTGHQAVEERARSELGMIKKGETFYQIIDPAQKSVTGEASANKNSQLNLNINKDDSKNNLANNEN